MKKKKRKKSKVKLVDSRSQLHALLDLLLTRAAETGSTYKGRFKIPLSKIVSNGHEGITEFEVVMLIRCNGRFIDESGTVKVSSNKGVH